MIFSDYNLDNIWTSDKKVLRVFPLTIPPPSAHMRLQQNSTVHFPLDVRTVFPGIAAAAAAAK